MTATRTTPSVYNVTLTLGSVLVTVMLSLLILELVVGVLMDSTAKFPELANVSNLM